MSFFVALIRCAFFPLSTATVGKRWADGLAQVPGPLPAAARFQEHTHPAPKCPGRCCSVRRREGTPTGRPNCRRKCRSPAVSDSSTDRSDRRGMCRQAPLPDSSASLWPPLRLRGRLWLPQESIEAGTARRGQERAWGPQAPTCRQLRRAGWVSPHARCGYGPGIRPPRAAARPPPGPAAGRQEAASAWPSCPTYARRAPLPPARAPAQRQLPPEP